MAAPDEGRPRLAPPRGLEAANDNQADDLAEARRIAGGGRYAHQKLAGREAVRRIGHARAWKLLTPPPGAARVEPVVTLWSSQTKTGRREKGGRPGRRERYPSMRSLAGALDRHAQGMEATPGERAVFSLSETQGSSVDDDTRRVCGILLDVDNPADSEAVRAFLCALDRAGVGYVHQERTTQSPSGEETTKHHIHIWFAEPLEMPQPADAEAKQRAKETLAFTLGVLEELAGVSLVHGDKLGGFDVAKAERLAGLVYPYAPKTHAQRVPRARAREGAGLSLEAVARLGFIPSGQRGAKPVAESVRAARRARAKERGLAASGWDNRDCPFGHKHGNGTPGGFGVNVETGGLKCHHGTCSGRTRAEWTAAIARTYPDLAEHMGWIDADNGARDVRADLEGGPTGKVGPTALDWQAAAAARLAEMITDRGARGALAWQAPTGTGKGHALLLSLERATGGEGAKVMRPLATRRVLYVTTTIEAAAAWRLKALARGLDVSHMLKLDAELCCAGGVLSRLSDGGSPLLQHVDNCDATKAMREQMMGSHTVCCSGPLAALAYEEMTKADEEPPLVVLDDVVTAEDDGARDDVKGSAPALGDLLNWAADFETKGAAYADHAVFARACAELLETGCRSFAELDDHKAIARARGAVRATKTARVLDKESSDSDIAAARATKRRNDILARLAHPRAVLEPAIRREDGAPILFATVPNELGEQAERWGEVGPVVIMDATLPAGLAATFPTLEVETHHVRDHVPTARAVVVAQSASKRGWNASRDASPDSWRWDRLFCDLEAGLDGLEHARRVSGAGAESLLIVTSKAQREALETPDLIPDEHRPRFAALRARMSPLTRWGHYGALRSINTHEDVDAVLTLGDPWAPGHATKGRAELAGRDAADTGREHVRAELAQAHGRARCRSPGRTKPVALVHVGTVAPADWGEDACAIRRHRGRGGATVETWTGLRWASSPLKVSETSAPSAEECGSAAASSELCAPSVGGRSLKDWRKAEGVTVAEAAERAGVAKSTWSRWERGETRPERGRWEAVERVLDPAAVNTPPTLEPSAAFTAPILPGAWPALPAQGNEPHALDGRTWLLGRLWQLPDLAPSPGANGHQNGHQPDPRYPFTGQGMLTILCSLTTPSRSATRPH